MLSNLPHVSQAGRARARITNQVRLTPKLLLLYLSAPPCCLHSWQAWLDCSLQAISKSSSPANLETIQSVKGEGRAILKERAFSSPAGWGGAVCHRLLRARKGRNVHWMLILPIVFLWHWAHTPGKMQGLNWNVVQSHSVRALKDAFVGENLTVLNLPGLLIAW